MRVTIPEGHIALIIPNQLSDELMSLLQHVRRNYSKSAVRIRLAEEAKTEPREDDQVKQQLRLIAGDVMLALLEAKEG